MSKSDKRYYRTGGIGMGLLRVNKDLCTECGACAAVCPAGIIALGENGPEELGSRICIACGHCVAACPVEALDHTRAPLTGQVSLKDQTRLDAAAAERFLRSRRSIRSYMQEQVPRETLRRVLDIARFASTGGNTQGLSYIVISDKKKLKQISAATLDWMDQEVAAGTERGEYFTGIVRAARETGRDVILRDAPHLIVALCDKAFLRGQENAHFALAYAELFAPTLGVGTCWAGLFMGCAFSNYAPLLDILDVPSNRKVAGGLMAGYPRYGYYRLVDRNELDVEWR
jgi:nitroreductase/Pyruvate/2-oxoacid:ferredoxin oxidoreductase delta subunit